MSERLATPSETLTSAGLHWPSLVQLLLGLVVVLNAVVLALFMVFGGALELGGGDTNGIAFNSFSYAGTAVFLTLVGIINIALAGLRLAGKPQRKNRPTGRFSVFGSPLIWVVWTAIALALGSLVSYYSFLPWLLLPPLHIVAVVLPILFLTWLAVRGLKPGSPQLTWGVLTGGMLVGPIFIFIAEFIALIFIGVFAFLQLAGKPELQSVLNRVMVYSQTTAAPNPERMLEMLRPMITEPLVLIVAISFFGVIVPLIEELFKPMGVWLLARRRLTPAQGFALGAISGAGYAVFETLGVQLPNELWLPLVSIRAVTGLLHVLTAGLVGYGLVEAWEYKRYLRLAALYLASVLLHGLWNSMVMLVAYSTMLHEVLSVPAEEALLGPFWMVGGGVGLFVIASVVFALLWGANQRLQPARLVPVGGEQDG